MFGALAYIPYLFADKLAWEETISDPRYRYDMPFFEFQKIYSEKVWQHQRDKEENSTKKKLSNL